MIQILIDNPLLLLFVVAAFGYLLGRISTGGVRLGIAAVLFVGIGFGALHPDLKLPEIISNLGLVLFVYTVGLSNGPVFFSSFRGKELINSLMVIGIMLSTLLLASLAHNLLQLKATQTAGLYVGGLNNTAALAGVLEYIKFYTPQAGRDALLNEVIVGFSITFPMGVIATILSINLAKRWWKIDYAEEAKKVPGFGPDNLVTNTTLLVTNPEASAETIHELVHNHAWDVLFGRTRRGDSLLIVSGSDRLQLGDLVSVVGKSDDLQLVTDYLGQVADERLDLDRSEFDFRRIFVSDPRVVGRRLKELNLPEKFDAVVTRVRRGDVEFIPHGDTVLELGDRVRVVTRRETMPDLTRYFGDSYRALSEIDVLTFSVGLAVGLLVGIIPIPLPGGLVIRLGFAGGPLIVALILGALVRTRTLIWNLPYSANLILRQFGLILFLAGVGTRSGYAFISTVAQPSTLPIFLTGLLLTLVVSFSTLWIGYKRLKIPMPLLIGMLAGIMTQPAVLSFAVEQTGNDLPSIGFAKTNPTALISKILLAQVLLVLFLTK